LCSKLAAGVPSHPARSTVFTEPAGMWLPCRHKQAGYSTLTSHPAHPPGSFNRSRQISLTSFSVSRLLRCLLRMRPLCRNSLGTLEACGLEEAGSRAECKGSMALAPELLAQRSRNTHIVLSALQQTTAHPPCPGAPAPCRSATPSRPTRPGCPEAPRTWVGTGGQGAHVVQSRSLHQAVASRPL